MARARSAANKAIKASNNQQASTKQKQQQAKLKVRLFTSNDFNLPNIIIFC